MNDNETRRDEAHRAISDGHLEGIMGGIGGNNILFCTVCGMMTSHSRSSSGGYACDLCGNEYKALSSSGQKSHRS